jgi:hypothetical protein
LSVERNLFYNNGSNTVGFNSISANNYSEDNRVGNPGFISTTNYHLSSVSSPAYHMGLYVGLSTDKDGYPWNNPPSIGAYER